MVTLTRGRRLIGGSPRLGLMFHGASESFFDPLRRGFVELGYVEGRNLLVESRFEGRVDRLPALAAELVDLSVDVIIAVGALSAQAAGKVTTKTPIVFSAVIDPVAIGLVESLDRPGRNITGVISADRNQPTKQFELLKQILPKLTRVALLSDQEILPDTHSDRGLDPLERANDTAARQMGLQPQRLYIKGPNPDIEAAIAAMKREGAEALVVLEGPVTIAHRKRIAEVAIARRLPTMFAGGRTVSDAGALIAYGTSLLDTLPRVPTYVDRILKGAKPAEMPIEVITRPELVFDLNTARRIDVTIPPELLKRANRVVQ